MFRDSEEIEQRLMHSRCCVESTEGTEGTEGTEVTEGTEDPRGGGHFFRDRTESGVESDVS